MLDSLPAFGCSSIVALQFVFPRSRVSVKVCPILVAGIIYYACERSRRKPVDEEDGKLGR